ncbi:MAG TPA: TIGR03016 family PEP-CTERM system-associated outer membrane protein [Rhizomicrobium sp.]|nr:TIGR03016 family PEP-CTERM system-associated outer membrane protein [Rhizomicrobium sp.]
MRHKTNEPVRLRRNLRNNGAAFAALAASLLAAPWAYAQDAPASGGGASQPVRTAQTSTTVSQSASQTAGSTFVETLIPGLAFNAGVHLSESYVSNARGLSNNSQADYVTRFGVNLGLNEHSRRVSIDATYAGSVHYYAQDSQPVQFTNYLQALANIIAVEDYVNIFGRAFAQPVVINNVGIVTANGGVSSDGYRNSYGFAAGPEVRFRLGNFATSQTVATYGATYFTDLAGASTFPVIPGFRGPQDMTMRSITQKISSGTDFSRLSWGIVGLFSEIDRSQGLLSEKAGAGQLRYAIAPGISLLATGGYDSISNSTPLFRNISGPIGMGGISIAFGEDFFFEFQVGQKYNSASYQGSLRWNLSPTSVLAGAATDEVTTPEGQLLNSLNDLTATPDGTLTSSANVYANGTAATLGSFNAQPLGNTSFNQNIARYQRLNLSFSQDFERQHANVSVYATRQTYLSGFFIGPSSVNSWGMQGSFSHDFTRLFTGTIGAGYTSYEQFGGDADTFNLNGQLSYSLSPQTNVYLRSDYLNRHSSRTLQTLSPITGSLDDVRVTVGISHRL